MTKIDFSIIVPVYNCETYLERCINSIINQTLKNFELILIDDGSTDGSLKICNKFREEYVNIHVISKKNSGVSDSRNIGIKKAKGKYICFVDSDDYIDNSYLKYVKEIFEKMDVQLVNTGFYSEIHSGDKITQDQIFAEEKLYANKNEIKNDLVYLWDTHMLYNIWNKVYLKNIIDENKIEFSDLNFGEDMIFNMHYLNHVDKFFNSSNIYYHYVKERKNSITTKYNHDLFNIRIKEYYMFNEYFQINGISQKEYSEFSSRRYIERILGCIENICGSDLKLIEKKREIKKIISFHVTKETVKVAEPRSKKIKIMLIPVKMRMPNITLFMGVMINKIRKNNPALFNQLKNRR